MGEERRGVGEGKEKGGREEGECGGEGVVWKWGEGYKG